MGPAGDLSRHGRRRQGRRDPPRDVRRQPARLPGVQLQTAHRPRNSTHDFLWRTTRCLPERGRIGIFNRSYYEDVLIARVHPEILHGHGLPDELIDEKTLWEQRYRSIRDLETHLHRNGTQIVKIFLHLSKDEQAQRFRARIDAPDKNWKFSLADIHERSYWDTYSTVYGDCLQRDQHRACPLVRRAGRRQRQRPTHRLPDRPRHPRRPQDGLPANHTRAPPGTGVIPKPALTAVGPTQAVWCG